MCRKIIETRIHDPRVQQCQIQEIYFFLTGDFSDLQTGSKIFVCL